MLINKNINKYEDKIYNIISNSEGMNTKLKISEDIKKEIKPLDIIVFRCDNLISNVISTVEKIGNQSGQWSHVGIVINTSLIKIKNANNNDLYFWESTIFKNFPDIETNTNKLGPQIHKLEDILEHYTYNPKICIGWYHMISNFNMDDNKYKILNNFHEKNYNDIYDITPLHLFKSIIPLFKIPDAKKQLFCSQLVAKVYQCLGLIPNNIDTEIFSPSNIMNTQYIKFDKPIILYNSY